MIVPEGLVGMLTSIHSAGNADLHTQCAAPQLAWSTLRADEQCFLKVFVEQLEWFSLCLSSCTSVRLSSKDLSDLCRGGGDHFFN